MEAMLLLPRADRLEKLKLTPLRISNIPPPMSASELILPAIPTHVSFESIGKSFAILRERHVDIATWTDFNTIRVANPKIVFSIKYLPPGISF
jgi:elongator complex protein 1